MGTRGGELQIHGTAPRASWRVSQQIINIILNTNLGAERDMTDRTLK